MLGLREQLPGAGSSVGWLFLNRVKGGRRGLEQDWEAGGRRESQRASGRRGK